MSESESEYKEARLKEFYDNYNIDIIDKFMVEELINLEDEYRSLIPSKDNVLTRKNMLEMIDRVKSRLYVKKKDSGILYFDLKRGIEKEDNGCIIYYEDKVYNLIDKTKKLTLKDYAKFIYDLVKDKNVKVYSDKMGLSINVCDELEILGVETFKLNMKNPFKFAGFINK